MGNPLDIVLKPSEVRGSGKWPIKIFKDLKVQKSSEIFLASSGSFRRWRGIHKAHKTRGRIPVSSEGSNYLGLEPLEYHTPPVGTVLPLQLVPDQEMSDIDPNNMGSSSRHCACTVHASSNQENEHLGPLMELPVVPLDPIDATIVMHQN